MRAFDVVVVGAGPAGLSLAAELATVAPRTTCLLVEGGPALGERVRSETLAGVGGAGLYSDGKHSFYPSATRLWSLADRPALAAANEATAALLARHGIVSTRGAAAPPPMLGDWTPKHYPSHYLDFAGRRALIAELWAAATPHCTYTTVTSARRTTTGFAVELSTGETIIARHLVVATGRLSPPTLRPWLTALGAAYAFQRIEVGVRLALAAAHPFFAALPGTDGKLIFRHDEMSEFRTFCTCRDGELVLGRTAGFAAYSGRADGPRTGQSNVGLVVRSIDPVVSAATLGVLAAGRTLTCSLADWRRDPSVLAPVVGTPAAALLAIARDRLLAWAPALRDAEAAVLAPCIEGIGEYPLAPADDLLLAPGLWLAGDAAGRFRGIVASMISGRYVARRIASAR